MLRVGLTGGLASGKSFVGGEFGRLGCLVVKADEIGHQVLEPAGEAYYAVIDEFGREILDSNDAINRRVLGGAGVRTTGAAGEVERAGASAGPQTDREAGGRFRRARAEWHRRNRSCDTDRDGQLSQSMTV